MKWTEWKKRITEYRKYWMKFQSKYNRVHVLNASTLFRLLSYRTHFFLCLTVHLFFWCATVLNHSQILVTGQTHSTDESLKRKRNPEKKSNAMAKRHSNWYQTSTQNTDCILKLFNRHYIIFIQFHFSFKNWNECVL